MEKLSQAATDKLLKKFRIPAVPGVLARSEKEAVAAASRLGFPVVMKIVSPEIIHKTERKGVALGILRDQVAPTYRALRKAAGSAKVEGVLIQQQATGREMIVGSKVDPTFGPVLMVGLGGIFVEVLQDVSFRLVPLERKDAGEMLRELKGYALLAGARGQKPLNLAKLEDFLLAVSRMVEKTPAIKELDINPAFATDRGIWAADVRVIV